MSDEEILSGFTSLHDAIQGCFIRLEQRLARRFATLEERVGRMELRLEAIERRSNAADPALHRLEPPARFSPATRTGTDR